MYFRLKVDIPSLIILGHTVYFDKIGDNQTSSILLKDHNGEEIP